MNAREEFLYSLDELLALVEANTKHDPVRANRRYWRTIYHRLLETRAVAEQGLMEQQP